MVELSKHATDLCTEHVCFWEYIFDEITGNLTTGWNIIMTSTLDFDLKLEMTCEVMHESVQHILSE